jgi:hypothetical protein
MFVNVLKSPPIPWIAISFFLSNLAWATESGKNGDESGATEKALRIVPLLTSTPLTGTGVGLSASYLYQLDESSKSQLQIGGQYSNTDSVTLFVRNNSFFNDDGIGLRYAIQSRTGLDLRLDVVTTSENEESVYLTLNQAF